MDQKIIDLYAFECFVGEPPNSFIATEGLGTTIKDAWDGFLLTVKNFCTKILAKFNLFIAKKSEGDGYATEKTHSSKRAKSIIKATDDHINKCDKTFNDYTGAVVKNYEKQTKEVAKDKQGFFGDIEIVTESKQLSFLEPPPNKIPFNTVGLFTEYVDPDISAKEYFALMKKQTIRCINQAEKASVRMYKELGRRGIKPDITVATKMLDSYMAPLSEITRSIKLSNERNTKNNTRSVLELE